MLALLRCTAESPKTDDVAAAPTGPPCLQCPLACASRSRRSAGAAGKPLPAIAVRCFDGGRYVDAAQLGNAPTILNLWRSNCEPCRTELPAFQRFVTAAGTRSGWSASSSWTPVPPPQSVIDDKQLTFPMLEDRDQQFAIALSQVVGKSVASALPATLFIAPGGRIVYTYQGIALDDEKIRALTAGAPRDRGGGMSDLPDWLEPLLTRLQDAEAGDFTRLPTPDGEGQRQSAVLVLFGEQPDERPRHPGAPACRDDAQPRRAAGVPRRGGRPGRHRHDRLRAARGRGGGRARPGHRRGRGDPADAVDSGQWLPGHAGGRHGGTRRIPVGPATRPRWPGSSALPIRDLVDPANRLRVRHPSGWIGPAFEIHDMLVWGFTAGVVSTLLELGWMGGRVADRPG